MEDRIGGLIDEGELGRGPFVKQKTTKWHPPAHGQTERFIGTSLPDGGWGVRRGCFLHVTNRDGRKRPTTWEYLRRLG